MGGARRADRRYPQALWALTTEDERGGVHWVSESCPRHQPHFAIHALSWVRVCLYICLFVYSSGICVDRLMLIACVLSHYSLLETPARLHLRSDY